MSKIIRMTQEYIDECCEEFRKSLTDTKLSDGKISYSKTLNSGKDRATLFFTANAWAKMITLLNEFNKEVAWHGVASRFGDTANEYLISDILVYPQEVTGASVDMDPDLYDDWFRENGDDDRFYNIRMQGHSHVNMAPTPSSVDLQHQEDILSQVRNDGFYIFMIYNKSYKHNIKIYDLRENVLFEDGDIDVKMYDASCSLDEFIKDAKEKVREKKYSYTYQNVTNNTKAITATVRCEDRPKVKFSEFGKSSNFAYAEDDDPYYEYYRYYDEK